jgi:glycosyltransferase involved in cell wall biosynthesis
VRLVDALTGRLLVDRFHAVSDGVRDANARALHIPLDRIVVAERGREAKVVADGGVPAHVRAELGVTPTQALVLALGRQEHQKAHADLVRAVPHLTELGVDAVVAIAGREGNASAVLRETIAEVRGAAEPVRVLGHRTDVDRLLAAAEVLAIPSHFEGTAGVAIEAMAAGTPIVSTDLDGLRGVLDDGRNAVLVPIADPCALAAGIARVLLDHDLAERLATTGRQDYERRFTIEAGAARMAALYRDVLAGVRPRTRRPTRERPRRS